MCVGMLLPSAPKISAAPPIIAATNNTQAVQQADLEAALRQKRAGAAANVLTSATGIPAGKSTPTMGGVAA